MEALALGEQKWGHDEKGALTEPTDQDKIRSLIRRRLAGKSAEKKLQKFGSQKT